MSREWQSISAGIGSGFPSFDGLPVIRDGMVDGEQFLDTLRLPALQRLDAHSGLFGKVRQLPQAIVLNNRRIDFLYPPAAEESLDGGSEFFPASAVSPR